MATSLYSTSRWQQTRAQALARDGNTCSVARLFRGACSTAPLHVHHIVPVSDGGDPFDLDNLASTCSVHHPMWEAVRRVLAKQIVEGAPRCGHHHTSAESRRLCEARLARRRGMVAA